MKAFWCIRPAIGDGSQENGWRPEWPDGFSAYAQILGDLRVFSGSGHSHAQVSALALQDDHYHQIMWNDAADGWYQEWFGTDPGAVEHSHVVPVGPSHFTVFVMCSDAMAQLFVDAVGAGLVVGQAEVTTDGEGGASYGQIINTPWAPAKRTAWENRIEQFGLHLPAAVTNDRRLANWLNLTFHHDRQNRRSEYHYRERSGADYG